MQDLIRKIQASIRALVSGEPAPRIAGGSSTDWLPPVIGPSDWSVGIMADRSAAWYFERR